MKLSNYIIIVGFVLFYLAPILSFSQFKEKEIPGYKMTIKHQDSIVEFSLYLEADKIELNNNTIYYWYKANKIHQNYGDYHGSLIHGEYAVTGKKDVLLTKGQFEKGAKQGGWKSWYPDGKLKNISTWENGKLYGLYEEFDHHGNPVLTINYVNGLKDGKALWYLQDTLLVRYYKADIEVSKENYSAKDNISIKRLFTR